MTRPLFNHLRSRAAVLMQQKLTRNVGWLTGAELVSRLGRILAAVVLARQLDATAFGVAAIAITVFEIVRVFTENGIGASVVRAGRDEFDKIANTAHRLMWFVCIGLALIQLLIAAIIEALLPGRGVGAMVAVLGVVFLAMPLGLLHAYCLQRDERMKQLAALASAQAVADHVLTAILALSGFGAWAIVLPKVFTVPIWILGVRYKKPWRRHKAAGFAPVCTLLRFSLPVLGAELLTAFRDQLDKVIVSLTLGIDALGIYYFAFNAGLGVSTALNRAFSSAVYPNLCAAADKLEAYRKAAFSLGLPLSLAYCVQAAAAMIYVPIVFGSDWTGAAPLVALLCLGGPARLLVDGARMHARAEGNSGQEFVLAMGLSASVLVPFAAAAPFGLMAAAGASVLGATTYGFAVTFRPRRTSPCSFPITSGAVS